MDQPKRRMSDLGPSRPSVARGVGARPSAGQPARPAARPVPQSLRHQGQSAPSAAAHAPMPGSAASRAAALRKQAEYQAKVAAAMQGRTVEAPPTQRTHHGAQQAGHSMPQPPMPAQPAVQLANPNYIQPPLHPMPGAAPQPYQAPAQPQHMVASAPATGAMDGLGQAAAQAQAFVDQAIAGYANPVDPQATMPPAPPAAPEAAPTKPKRKIFRHKKKHEEAQATHEAQAAAAAPGYVDPAQQPYATPQPGPTVLDEPPAGVISDAFFEMDAPPVTATPQMPSMYSPGYPAQPEVPLQSYFEDPIAGGVIPPQYQLTGAHAAPAPMRLAPPKPRRRGLRIAAQLMLSLLIIVGVAIAIVGVYVRYYQ